MVTIATWTVNSVRPRLPQLLGWLEQDAPDIVLLQEIKCVAEQFPAMEIESLGYNLALAGQKTYNGVAILSKLPLDDVIIGLPGNEADDAARYIEAVASYDGGALRVASVYVPNGQSADSDKFTYKLDFLDYFQAHMQRLLRYDEAVIIGGDYNIAPYPIDVHDESAWAGSVLTHETVRSAMRRLLHHGLYDAFRLCHPQAHDCFSWWDYRGNGFAKDAGLRIDHLLLSPQAADYLTDCRILKDMRGVDKASDHAPVLAEFAF